ncbi:hypothetical protein BC830DRAFT_1225812 [Chytriomyces sp. MP71]|nr:hypothetical protein BC830DRAFT_1225812 [Chytriomyces sp. MP71]
MDEDLTTEFCMRFARMESDLLALKPLASRLLQRLGANIDPTGSDAPPQFLFTKATPTTVTSDVLSHTDSMARVGEVDWTVSSCDEVMPGSFVELSNPQAEKPELHHPTGLEDRDRVFKMVTTRRLEGRGGGNGAGLKTRTSVTAAGTAGLARNSSKPRGEHGAHAVRGCGDGVERMDSVDSTRTEATGGSGFGTTGAYGTHEKGPDVMESEQNQSLDRCSLKAVVASSSLEMMSNESPPYLAEYPPLRSVAIMEKVRSIPEDANVTLEDVDKIGDLSRSEPKLHPTTTSPGDTMHRNSKLTFPRSLQRRASTFTVGLTQAKYNAKGSIISLLESSQVLVPETFLVALNQSEIGRQGLNSMSEFSVNWDFGISLVYLLMMWLIPLAVGFDLHLPLGFSIFLSLIFAIDLILALITVRVTNSAMQAIKNPSLYDWQRHYLQRGFIVDLITTVPIELFGVGRKPLVFWLFRILRLYKLPHIMSVSPWYIGFVKILQKFFGLGQSVAMIFPLVFAFCAFLHIEGCAIFFTARLFDTVDPDITAVLHEGLFEQYTFGLYVALGNTFPTTYKPLHSPEKWVVLVFVILGAALYAGILGTISSLSMGIDASGRLYKQKLDEVREYIRWKNLGPTTHQKLLKYYELKYRGKFFEEGTLLNDMNDSLRMEIAAHNCRELISKVSFLRREQGDGRDELFLGRVATSLVACFFVPGDVIFTQGEVTRMISIGTARSLIPSMFQMANEMYFIMSGVVNVIVHGKRVASFKDGAFFGEVALMGNIPRTATVQAAMATMLYRLTRSAFTDILREFGDVKQKMESIYQERLEKIKLEEKEKPPTLK